MNYKISHLGLLLLSLIIFTGQNLLAQDLDVDGINGRDADKYNVITTAVPFLTIAPDSRAGAMGDVGASTSPDVWSMHWNPAKYSFSEDDLSIGFSFTPWLRSLGIKDIYLSKLAGYYKIDDRQTIAASLLYFTLGEITFTQDENTTLGTYEPTEWTFDLAYSRKLADHFSLSMAGRFIYSNLVGNFGGDGSKAGIAFAMDVAGYYTKEINIFGAKPTINVGFNISNMGSKISYTDGGEKDFIPTNLRIGVGGSGNIDEYNSIGVYCDLNKLLVPSENDGSDVGSVSGIFQSFSDAPGGFEEEMHEISLSTGIEYWYDKQFAVRGGFFAEHETKGDRKYFTMGVGVRLSVFGLDVSYLAPTNGNSPLANTLRFSLTLDFKGLKSEQKDKLKAAESVM